MLPKRNRRATTLQIFRKDENLYGHFNIIGWILGYLIYNRGEMEAKFLKPPGSTFFVRDGKITNTYNYTFLNKSNETKTVIIKIIEPSNGEISSGYSSNKIILKRDAMIKGTINVSFRKVKLNFQNKI
jgi:hypothetical protein